MTTQESEQVETSNILLDGKSLKFPILKIIHNYDDIVIDSKFSLLENKDVKKMDLKQLLTQNSNIKCSECQRDIKSFDFFINKGSKDIICNVCYSKFETEKINEKYISFENYISTCDKHGKKYELFCINCNKNMCSECKNEDLAPKHEFIIFENILDIEKLHFKQELCKKVKNMCQIFQNISEIQNIQNQYNESIRYHNLSERLLRENKYAEIIISNFSYFYEKKALCYELIGNFNDLVFNKLLKKINLQELFAENNNFLDSSFHVINQSKNIVEKNKVKIVPISKKNIISSDISLGDEIRGVAELKGDYYLAGSKNGIIGIFSLKDLNLIKKFTLKGIDSIFHLSKIKDNDLDLISIASNLNEIIILSVVKKEEKEDEQIDFDFKMECKKEGHTKKLNKVIQLTNGLIVTSSEDFTIIFWQLIKKENSFLIQSVSKVKIERDIYILIECPYTNELICNDITIDLKSFTIKRKFNLYLQDKTFNCSMCLFKEKYIAYVLECDGISVFNIETGKRYYITANFDYVEAVYTVDNETLCVCTQNLKNIIRTRYSQQYKLEEDEFVEIGNMTNTGTCNCYMTDTKNNFIMGDMGGIISKFTDEPKKPKTIPISTLLDFLFS